MKSLSRHITESIQVNESSIDVLTKYNKNAMHNDEFLTLVDRESKNEKSYTYGEAHKLIDNYLTSGSIEDELFTKYIAKCIADDNSSTKSKIKKSLTNILKIVYKKIHV